MGDVPAKTPSRLAKYFSLLLTLGLVPLFLALQVATRFLPRLRGTGVTVTAHGETLVYRASAWFLGPFLAPAAILLVLGWVFLRGGGGARKVAGGVLWLAAGLMTVVLVPTVFQGGLVLDPDGFTFTYGMWWRPESKAVRFGDLTSMAVLRRPRNGGTVDDTLECSTRDGAAVAMPLGDTLHVALPTIRRYAGAHGVPVVELRRRGNGPSDGAGGVALWLTVALLAIPGVILVGLLLFAYAAVRRHPTNRMSRRLQAGDVGGAIEIGESVPPERREFSTRCNLAVAYQQAGREAEARSVLAGIEAEGWNSTMGPEDQYRAILDHMRGVVRPGSGQPPPAG